MSRIRGSGNKDTELALTRLLRAHGITGWRRQQRLRIEGQKRRAGAARPTNVGIDFLFPKERVAVFVDGCFWHGCPKYSHPKKWLKKSAMPTTAGSRQGAKTQRTGKAFWREKMAANIARDRFVNRELRRRGWRVVRIWEHELASNRSQEPEVRIQKVMEKIRKALDEGRRGKESEEELRLLRLLL